ncbi:hypothetical protein FN846DRAFT_1014384 [Sphaerosporella brunnea]|uniref:PCI domain-containing protein n=1 Tax=Sphaerosporella brunnea TaxID=1250544 RepID=A0A5J5EWK4_9PEZI|nr:hypothetical protein FN846DRAFT_1014384 [Sphaerosporella brunnea]
MPAERVDCIRLDIDYYIHYQARVLGLLQERPVVPRVRAESHELPQNKQCELAYNLFIAALLSEKIYNFGEPLLHPILDSLLDIEHWHAWIRDLLFAFNTGDLGKYNALLGHLDKQPLFKKKQQFLRQKLCLSALSEAVFRQPPHDRALSFNTITRETGVQPDEVEYLLMMKALSEGLVRDSIDQVAGVARISWVQFKVLDKNQIENMRQRLMEWDSSVSKLNGIHGGEACGNRCGVIWRDVP